MFSRLEYFLSILKTQNFAKVSSITKSIQKIVKNILNKYPNVPFFAASVTQNGQKSLKMHKFFNTGSTKESLDPSLNVINIPFFLFRLFAYSGKVMQAKQEAEERTRQILEKLERKIDDLQLSEHTRNIQQGLSNLPLHSNHHTSHSQHTSSSSSSSSR